MNKNFENCKVRLNYLIFGPGAIIIIVSLFMLFAVNSTLAQDKAQTKEKSQIQQFVDEDGDGFNDLLPDHDGDGIPNLIDPDFKGHSAESLYMHRYMHGQTIEAERNRFRHTYQHGEPGQYGPSDSTGHGQGDGTGDHHGNPGSGNEGEGGGSGGGQGGGEGNGGHGKISNISPADVKSTNVDNRQNKKDPGDKGGKGGR